MKGGKMERSVGFVIFTTHPISGTHRHHANGSLGPRVKRKGRGRYEKRERNIGACYRHKFSAISRDVPGPPKSLSKSRVRASIEALLRNGRLSIGKDDTVGNIVCSTLLARLETI